MEHLNLSQNQYGKILIMAGGTGGHIFPGLAVADMLKKKGWEVEWLGGDYGLEQQLVGSSDILMHSLRVRGIRGRSWWSRLVSLGLMLRAFIRALRIIQERDYDIILGFGGYPSVPGGLAAFFLRKPLIIHEQNAIAGFTNRILSKWATRVLGAFPSSKLPGQITLGNPVRSAFASLAAPIERFSGRSGPLRLLVFGGSLGAKIFNDCIPKAIQKIPQDQRPMILHQSGKGHLEYVQNLYNELGVEARCVEFIDDMVGAYGWADWVISRSGALTVSELAACGLGAWFVPLPHAVDDHQRFNAQYLTDRGGGILLLQEHFTPDALAKRLLSWSRDDCQSLALKAYECGHRYATDLIVRECEEMLFSQLKNF
jgi:UDP-N-acetylglucosamine--N-acetylmuramyl-(pentapeptide) pyrophosphoryl-undecaprenol N-acetylglucosamine transferase